MSWRVLALSSGLFLSVLSQAHAQQFMGHLQVDGQITQGQVDFFEFVRCEVTGSWSNRSPIPGSCVDHKRFPLNAKVKVPVGWYLVSYSGVPALKMYEVRSGATTMVRLKKLAIAPQSGQRKDFEGKVFLDLTNSNGRKALWYATLSDPLFDLEMRDYCRYRAQDSFINSICEYYMSGSHSLQTKLFNFFRDGAFQEAELKKFKQVIDGRVLVDVEVRYSSEDRFWLKHNMFAKEILAIDGTYAVEFRSLNNGRYSTRYGIRSR